MSDCILWAGAKSGAGYGMKWSNGRVVSAHRLAAEAAYGPIPPGLVVAHRCDTPACVNPEHLFICTQAENMADMRAKGRSSKGDRHKSRTQPDSTCRGEDVGTSRLTQNQVDAIRGAYSTGKSGVKRANSIQGLANQYGVSYGAIYNILNRKTWNE